MNRRTLKTSRKMYKPLPDSSALDYNRIYDVIDEVVGTKKIAYKDAERFMYQYKDAMRNYGFIRERYDYLSAPDEYMETTVLQNPERALLVKEARGGELPGVKWLLDISTRECLQMRTTVGRLICMLKDEKQRLIMTAHYICMADWKHISAVFGHQDRWAKDIHVNAMKTIDGLFRHGDWYAPDRAADQEIDILIREWRIAERRWYEAQEQKWLAAMDTITAAGASGGGDDMAVSVTDTDEIRRGA